MRFQYRLTFQDFLASLALHSKRNLFRSFFRLLFTFGFPILGLFQWISVLFNFAARDRADIFWTLFFGATLVAFPFWFRFLYWIHYRRTVSQESDTAIDLDPDKIRCQSAHTRSEIEWTGILRFAEDKRTFILYTAPGKYLLIPKRVCSDQEVAQLRILLQERINPQAPALA
jgi:hypothetical protein